MPKETPNDRAARLSLYQAYTESGQTMTEFAKERRTTYWKVKNAVKKSEAEVNRGRGGMFQEVSMPGMEMGNEYAVTLRNGRELRIPQHFTEKRVRQLVEILETC